MPQAKKKLPAEKERSELWAENHEKSAFLQRFHKNLRLSTSPACDLALEELVPESPGLIILVRDFLDGSECDSMISAIEKVGLNASNKADLNPKKGEAFLDRFNLTFTDPDLCDLLWQRLKPLLPPFQGREAVGLFRKLRYYRYNKGQRFTEHVDVCERSPGQQSEYTLLIYLNSEGECDLSGGETIFYSTKKKELCSVSPLKGAVLLHAHGRRCLMHEGALVKKGFKYVFRTDVMYQT
ncbi:hypothetical protein DIPPA_70216 [Diplonema papillatum]|nr:hypothetical protein DIPPA_70216 [Diplonema papillatum]